MTESGAAIPDCSSQFDRRYCSRASGGGGAGGDGSPKRKLTGWWRNAMHCFWTATRICTASWNLDTLGWRKTFDLFRNLERNPQGPGRSAQTRYDAALDFQGLWKSAVVAWLSRSRERIGFTARSVCGSPAPQFFIRSGFHRARHVHVVEENLALVDRSGSTHCSAGSSPCRGMSRMTRTWRRNLPRSMPENSSS